MNIAFVVLLVLMRLGRGPGPGPKSRKHIRNNHDVEESSGGERRQQSEGQHSCAAPERAVSRCAEAQERCGGSWIAVRWAANLQGKKSQKTRMKEDDCTPKGSTPEQPQNTQPKKKKKKRPNDVKRRAKRHLERTQRMARKEIAKCKGKKEAKTTREES